MVSTGYPRMKTRSFPNPRSEPWLASSAVPPMRYRWNWTSSPVSEPMYPNWVRTLAESRGPTGVYHALVRSHLWYWMNPGTGGATVTLSARFEPAVGSCGLSSAFRVSDCSTVISRLTPSGSPLKLEPRPPEML